MCRSFFSRRRVGSRGVNRAGAAVVGTVMVSLSLRSSRSGSTDWRINRIDVSFSQIGTGLDCVILVGPTVGPGEISDKNTLVSIGIIFCHR